MFLINLLINFSIKYTIKNKFKNSVIILNIMTRRQQIIEILQQNKQTAQQLANYFQTTLKEIIEDLQHIEMSVNRKAISEHAQKPKVFDKSIKPKKLKINSAYCKKCNFVFRERSKISKPSKCPRCKSEWIEAQMFSIQ